MNLSIKTLLSNNDEVLKPIIQEVTLPTLASSKSVFHDLMSCVIEQQIHYRSSKNTFTKLLQVANIELLTLGNFSTSSSKFSHSARLG